MCGKSCENLRNAGFLSVVNTMYGVKTGNPPSPGMPPGAVPSQSHLQTNAGAVGGMVCAALFSDHLSAVEDFSG